MDRSTSPTTARLAPEQADRLLELNLDVIRAAQELRAIRPGAGTLAAMARRRFDGAMASLAEARAAARSSAA